MLTPERGPRPRVRVSPNPNENVNDSKVIFKCIISRKQRACSRAPSTTGAASRLAVRGVPKDALRTYSA